MYMITEAQRNVRIPPKYLGEDIEDVIGSLSSEAYEGRLEEDKSITVLVGAAYPEGPGRIVHGDGAVYQTVKMKQLSYYLTENEVVEGIVVDVLKFGAFIRFGPLDGLLHVSQVMDDRVDVDEANKRLVGKESGRTLSVGDRVRARVVSIELNEKSPQDSKIGLTMRQPGLGRLEWIEEDARKAAGAGPAGEKKSSSKKGKKKGGEE
jgi:DNA-directed RNA polymerase subunit E'